MRFDPANLPDSAHELLRERHLATLSTLRRDSTPHVTPVGFTFDAEAGLARVICSGDSQKVRNIERTPYAAICQTVGAQWFTLEGPAHVERDPEAVRDAEQRYAERYRVPRVNPKRVVLVVKIERVTGYLRSA
ncbi:TIGR03618 family F420-dependent PPOX class oxidoreductase [Epidermidibacterium keratini]|uniref:TIGR03618 family F420-dependent PPOX class oxidoreductase n=1 Tax=Epidermidibacterium keratini TaxID=1891644 RepID=A0A7L4YM89_9ACTN|nr:PPOX class F420-dependent oxidoreductase [Epidermidibacterium keratini]QHC00172.1 TIGR03618 family F420-dependent PPOX class oxidoreductase [Epidermidibacterium keratini]